MDLSALKNLLEEKYRLYHSSRFIEHDPISVPHSFTLQQDIEIAAFITATISWGNRKSIITHAKDLFERMDNTPYAFVKGHRPSDLKKLNTWGHRTFQTADLLGFIHFLRQHYQRQDSLESAFLEQGRFISVKHSLATFATRVFEDKEGILERTRKHVSNPERGSACKRLNMLLRWMVRPAEGGVDFGMWKQIPVSALMMPLDVHVERVAKNLGMLTRKQSDWKSVEELTGFCRLLDAGDPVKYDYALFGMGIEQKKISPEIL